MKTLTTALALAMVMAVLTAATAGAQISNGDFSAGLAGWTPATSGTAGVQAVAYGLPSQSVNLRRVVTITGPPLGTASVSQAFTCAGEGPGGTCDITLDYIVFTNDPVVQFTVSVDGTVLHTSSHGPLHRSDWAPVTLAVACGEHVITIAASATVQTGTDDWNVNVDNVTAVCQGSVATEPGAWGSLKATYR